MSPAALVVLNPAARHHTALAGFSEAAPELRSRFALSVVTSDLGGRWRETVGVALSRGVRVFIAAGGDGTVGALADAIASLRGAIPLGELWLGAIGLGSSNDFHKPVRRIARVPLRIDLERATPRDLGLARWEDEQGRVRERVFVVSASIGAVANANAFFNDGDRMLRWLKRRWVGGAILYAACAAIARHRNLRVVLRWPSGASRGLELASLSVLKTPHLAGGLAFDTPVGAADGHFAVNLARGRSRRGLLRLLAGLAVGRFRGRPGNEHHRAAGLEVASGEPFALELDGETVRACRVCFQLLGERVKACA